MVGAIRGSRSTDTRGNLAPPNNREFLRISVIERSLHYATFAICDVPFCKEFW
ncbi:hypothetical protein PDE_02334 [Penicillium oxalicum 114-2]|uniref:Uncharacterized protein n=1 Tax=Penicillium oxalicum (strain 114-2 / CGMCC 5302) TaxID=933388 RepID=S7ZFH8_PENO1|nr:hypothetical protein PDE_02334 [Penicillium oxalicum 114-2]